MLVASLSLMGIFLNMFFANPSPRNLVSLDWAGYVVASDYVNPQPMVTGVNASWLVPSVNVSVEDTFAAVWIGVGGQLDNTLIQAGTEQDSINGVATYSAWYELLPDHSVTISSINVRPEDEIKASIHLVDSLTNSWSVEIVDVTSNQRFQKEFSYGSSRLSADCIVERPNVNNVLSKLADFGSVTFTGASVTLNATIGQISSFPFYQVTMHDRQNRQLATASSLSADGSSFTVKYLSVT